MIGTQSIHFFTIIDTQNTAGTLSISQVKHLWYTEYYRYSILFLTKRDKLNTSGNISMMTQSRLRTENTTGRISIYTKYSSSFSERNKVP